MNFNMLWSYIILKDFSVKWVEMKYSSCCKYLVWRCHDSFRLFELIMRINIRMLGKVSLCIIFLQVALSCCYVSNFLFDNWQSSFNRILLSSYQMWWFGFSISYWSFVFCSLIIYLHYICIYSGLKVSHYVVLRMRNSVLLHWDVANDHSKNIWLNYFIWICMSFLVFSLICIKFLINFTSVVSMLIMLMLDDFIFW